MLTVALPSPLVPSRRIGTGGLPAVRAAAAWGLGALAGEESGSVWSEFHVLTRCVSSQVPPRPFPLLGL